MVFGLTCRHGTDTQRQPSIVCIFSTDDVRFVRSFDDMKNSHRYARDSFTLSHVLRDRSVRRYFLLYFCCWFFSRLFRFYLSLCRNPHIRWWDFCDCIFIWHKQQRSSVEIYWCTNESTWRWMNRESFFSVLRSSLTFFVFTFSVNVVQPLLSLSWWRTDSLSAVFFLPLFVELMFDDCFFCDVVHFVEMKKYIHFSVRHTKLMDKVGQSIHLRISVVKWSTDNALFFLYRKITAKKRDSVVNRQFSRFKWTTKRREQIEFKSVFMSQFWKLKLHQLLLLLFWIRNHIEIKRETEEFHCKT